VTEVQRQLKATAAGWLQTRGSQSNESALWLSVNSCYCCWWHGLQTCMVSWSEFCTQHCRVLMSSKVVSVLLLVKVIHSVVLSTNTAMPCSSNEKNSAWSTWLCCAWFVSFGTITWHRLFLATFAKKLKALNESLWALKTVYSLLHKWIHHHHLHHHHHLFVEIDNHINMIIWHMAAEQDNRAQSALIVDLRTQ